MLHEDPGLGVGKRVELKLSTPLGKRRWVAEHTACEEGGGFVDTQLSGPFASWQHSHTFRHIDDRQCELIDEIEYALPAGAVGERLAGDYSQKKLERAFAYRHAVTQSDLALRRQLEDFRPMRILVSGGSGFLGTRLVALLRTQGHEVSILTRHKREESDIRWDPSKGEIELSRLSGFGAVINLAGASLSSGRWTEERKKLLWKSRIDSTCFLVNAFSRLDQRPSIFLSGSGIGFYGSDPEEEFTESARRGSGFLPELCEAWEAAAYRAKSIGCRVVLLRTGIVMDPNGGALKQMMPIFKLGAGGPIGSGEQWFPWIALEDWMRAVVWSLFTRRVKGPVNLVAPEVVRQKAFAKTLGETLHRPAFLPAPKFALRTVLGEMADAALLTSIRAQPRALEESGFDFSLPQLDQALAFSLGK